MGGVLAGTPTISFFIVFLLLQFGSCLATFGVHKTQHEVFLDEFQKQVQQEFSVCRTEMMAMLQHVEEEVLATRHAKESSAAEQDNPSPPLDTAAETMDVASSVMDEDAFEDPDLLPSLSEGQDSVQNEKLDIFADLSPDALEAEDSIDSGGDMGDAVMSESLEDFIVGETDEEENEVVARVSDPISLKHEQLSRKPTESEKGQNTPDTETIDVKAKTIKKKSKKHRVSSKKAKTKREESLATLEVEWQGSAVQANSTVTGMIERVRNVINVVLTYALIWFASDFLLAIVQRILREKNQQCNSQN